MIILSAGMPRAGSGWYYNLTNDLMLATGARPARQIRQRYHLENILTEVNCNIGALTPRRVFRVLIPAMLGNTFVIKAHAAPSRFALQVIRLGMMRPTYIYRDPRDALLSAMENGRRANERGHPNAFSPYADFYSALRFIEEYLAIWESWMKCGSALKARYEDLLLNYDTEAEQLARFLGLNPKEARLRAVLDQYRPENTQTDQKGLHFRHGKIGRFRQKLTSEEQAILNQRLAPFLERMGYEQ